MTDDHDLGSQPQRGDQAAIDARIELGYALATYIAKYPLRQVPLPERVARLTARKFTERGMTELVQETEYWLSVLDAPAQPYDGRFGWN